MALRSIIDDDGVVYADFTWSFKVRARCAAADRSWSRHNGRLVVARGDGAMYSRNVVQRKSRHPASKPD